MTSFLTATSVLDLIAAGGNPINHIVDKKAFGTTWLWLSMLSLAVAGALALLIMARAAKAIATGPESMGHERYVTKGRLSQLVETISLYLRDEMLKPVMGERLANAWLPFLLAQFFLILTLNLFGLVPFFDAQEFLYGIMGKKLDPLPLDETHVLFGGAATASISVTAGLAVCSFFAILWQSIRELGVKGTLEHLCGGPDLVRGPLVLWLVIPIIFAVELAGMFIKPAALAVRLFANMVAGHTLLVVLFGFGASAYKLGVGGVAGVTAIAGVFAVAITFLELFVAFLQSFVFMFLTAVFISLMSHGDEHHEHEHEHGHGAEAHAHAH
ncbi:MAG: F0F1 ATP synthase subunit A [Phycisphaerales bacterium]|nr:F0F1 ATP synthase subunit A [Phycisphaerales bacterium]